MHRLTMTLVPVAAVATLVAGCGGGGHSYAAGPTASCLKQHGNHVQLSTPQAFESRLAIVGAVETQMYPYTVDVVFLKNSKAAQREIASVAASEAVDLAGTPSADKSTVKRVLTSHDYVRGNARIRWRGGPADAVPGAMLHRLDSCLR